MHLLNLQIPPYVRIDFVHINLRHAPRKKTYVKWMLKVASLHGSRAPLSFVKSVEVSFPERPDMKTAFLTKQPFVLKRETARKRPFMMALKFNFTDGCRCSFTTVFWGIDFQVKLNSFIRDKNEVLKKLRDDADHESKCGQQEILEKLILPRSESTIHAITTNIMRYNLSDPTQAEEAISISDCSEIKRFGEGENGEELSSKRAKWF